MEYSYQTLFNYFKRFISPYWGTFFLGSFLRLLSAILWLYSAYAFSQLVTFVTKYHQGDSLGVLYAILISWTISFLGRYTLIFFAKYLCINIGYRASLDVERTAVEHLSQLDISWHEKENSGNKVKRIQKGAEGIHTLVRVWIVNIIDIGVNIVGTFFIISHFNLVLALLVILYQVIHFLISNAFRRQTMLVARQKNIKTEESTGLTFEIVNNIRSVKVLGFIAPLLGYIKNVHNELVVLFKKNMFWYHGQIWARATWQDLVRVILLGFVAYGIFEGKYEVGFLILFNGYFQNLSNSINDLSSVAQDVTLAKVDVGRLQELFNEKITIEDEKGKRDFPKEWDGIHVKNLSFSYGHGEVLSELSFDIKKGEKVGIIGLSGAGKSTLFKLLLKEYEDKEDSIMIGDVPLRQIKRSDYVHHVAAVLQETEVFNMSLRNNIAIANIQAETEDSLVERSLRVSHVNDFLHKLPLGVHTVIGEKGVRLSGGEKQRLGIARAIFKNPEILFLDEATSHLDVESEQKIQDSLKQFFQNVTAVVIAHRLSTVKEMDRIIVLEGGKMIETGTFNELYEKEGRFRDFWDKQRI